MRALAQGVTYTLIAIVTGMALSVTYTTGSFWLVMLVCFIAWIAILVGKWIQTGRELDAFLASEDERLAQDVAGYHCAGHGHYYGPDPIVTPTSRIWTCKNCGHTATVTRSDVLFDQDGAA